MKIVQVEDFFHPDAGYQINVLSRYLSSFGHDVTIITSELDKVPENLTSFFGRDNIAEKDKVYTEITGVKIIRLPILAFISGRAIFGKALDKCINKLSPDILYIHGNDTATAMKYIMKIKKIHYVFITDSHMLEMASANKLNKVFRRFYKYFITPQIVKNKIPVIRTQNDNYVEKCLGIPLAQAPWISYGSDTLLFHPDENIKKQFREKNDIDENDFVVIYAGKLDEAKGGRFLADAFRMRFNSSRNIVLIVVGNTTGEYGGKVEMTFSRSENRIIRFPTQKYRDLAKFYQASDIAVFAKQCSLSFYDAQACGLPVLSEDNNINVDRCSHNNGWNFKAGNIKDFRKKIEFLVNMNNDKYGIISKNAYHYILENYNYEAKAREYEKVMLFYVKF